MLINRNPYVQERVGGTHAYNITVTVGMHHPDYIHAT